MRLEPFALRAAIAAADTSNYLDRIDHNEPAEIQWVRRSGFELRSLALDLAQVGGLSLLDLYAQRLVMIEERNVLESAYDGGNEALQAKSWRELQIVQAEHDRLYHPDVLGLSKLDQLRHYALHISKLAGAYARASAAGELTEEIRSRRMPDTLLFGLKLATVTGEKLSDDQLDQRALRGSASAVAA